MLRLMSAWFWLWFCFVLLGGLYMSIATTNRSAQATQEVVLPIAFFDCLWREWQTKLPGLPFQAISWGRALKSHGAVEVVCGEQAGVVRLE